MVDILSRRVSATPPSYPFSGNTSQCCCRPHQMPFLTWQISAQLTRVHILNLNRVNKLNHSTSSFLHKKKLKKKIKFHIYMQFDIIIIYYICELPSVFSSCEQTKKKWVRNISHIIVSLIEHICNSCVFPLIISLFEQMNSKGTYIHILHAKYAFGDSMLKVQRNVGILSNIHLHSMD